MIAVFALAMAVAPSPEERAVSFLSQEVPRWFRENRCFSCHNNGDAARALFEASRAGLYVPHEAIGETLEWLERPEKWDDNPGEEGFDDVTLARIQFASALSQALDSGLIDRRQALAVAAGLVRSDQDAEGSWKLDASASIGSPATYGRTLATAVARNVLEKAGGPGNRAAVARADRWLRGVEVKTVLDAAAVLLALDGAEDAEAVEKRRLSLELIAKAEAPSGGWGPYVVSAPEPFDTALVLLALVRERPGDASVAQGRAFLLESQLDDGSWPETTRPAGQRSYAQYISTTGWATLALLATR